MVTKEISAFVVVTKQKGAVLVAMSCISRGDKGAGCSFSGDVAMNLDETAQL